MRSSPFLALLFAGLLPNVARADTVSVSNSEVPYHCKKQRGDVALTFKPELDVKELVTWAVGFTCKEFVLDPRIVSTGRKVTLIAPTKMSVDEAYQMFLVALSTVGLTVVPKGNALRIVESARARTDSVPILKDPPARGTDQIVRYVLRPTHAQPEMLRSAFAAVKSDAGDIAVVGSLLVITDFASSVRDMVSLARLVDVPSGTDGIYTIPIVHADATKLADRLTTLLTTTAKPEPGQQTAPTAKIIVDDRTNMLIVAANEPTYARVAALVERLDIPLAIEGGVSIHVYQLGNAIAAELAKTLNEAIQGQTQQQPKTDTKPAAGDALAGLGAKLQGQAKVISDTPTNKLIVMSSASDFIALRDVIKELDVPRRQVYLETTIIEVAVGNGLQAGMSSHGTIPTGDGSSLVVGGVQTGDISSLNVSSLATATGLIGGIVGSTLSASTSLLGTSIPSYGALFRALADSSRTNIVSTPVLLALDNEQAKYKVGQNIPYKKGVLPTTADTATSALTTNIDRRDLLLELDIKPHISTNDSVLLELKLASEDLGETASDLGPTWTTRSFETRVLVRDQATIIVGGLSQEREVSTQSSVPVLGSIPLLGYLFKYSSKSKKKTTLLVMLTPYIIKDQSELEEIRARKAREYDEFVGSLRALDSMPFKPRIDYSRKRGLIEEINRSVLEVEEEAALRGKVTIPDQRASGRVAP